MRKLNLSEQDVKIYLLCDNLLLNIGISFYLKGYLSSMENADFVLTDRDYVKTSLPICKIGTDLKIPCSVYDIFLQLHDFYLKYINSKLDMDNMNELSNDHIFRRSDLDRLKNLQNIDLPDDVKNLLGDIAKKIDNYLKN